jgi:hypothetical protein
MKATLPSKVPIVVSLVSRRQLEVWSRHHRLQDRRLTTRLERDQPLLAYQQTDFAATTSLNNWGHERAFASTR